MRSSIRTRRGCCCWCFAIVVTVLSVSLEHMFGLTADSVAHTICGESRAGASTVTTVLNGWHSVSLTMPATALRCCTTRNIAPTALLLLRQEPTLHQRLIYKRHFIGLKEDHLASLLFSLEVRHHSNKNDLVLLSSYRFDCSRENKFCQVL